MVYLKKLLLAPLSFILLYILLVKLTPVLPSLTFLFEFNQSTFYLLLILSALISAFSLAFIVFATLASDWKLVLPVVLLLSVVTFATFPADLAIVLTVGIILALLIAFLSLESKMKGYLTFQPTSLLSSPVKSLATLLILVLSIGYYLQVNKVISSSSFEVPDSVIDTVLRFVPPTGSTVEGPQVPEITPEQVDLLKKNSALLKRSGIDPKALDSLSQKSNAPVGDLSELVRPQIKSQLTQMLKPYQTAIPVLLGLLLFLALQWIVTILLIFLSPLIWLIFLIFEKTKFITYTVETREVKKLVL